MALTDQESGEAYSFLTQVAKANSLDWVLQQAESQIALGRIRTGKVRAKEVPLRGTSDDEAERMSKGRPAKFTLSEEYSPRERLEILVQALEHAVCGVWQTAFAVSHFFSESIPNLSGIKFMPDGISRESFALEARELHAKEPAVEDFQDLIRELKEVI